MEKEKALITKKRMFLREIEHLQSTLRIRISTCVYTFLNDIIYML